MAYQALYRKYRPQTLSDVCGQDHIVRALKGQLKNGNIGHAYLFCGTRGTGKTTVAKILARAVNCENPTEDGPCNVCPTCQSILRGANLAVAEIDGASSNKVEYVRNIIDEVQYLPQGGKKKVYIIDEAHMLTDSSVNALLKTLEEPPEYALFILCTTDPGRLLQTILSRCQRYDFRYISLPVIADRLAHVCDMESIEIEENALRYIASAGDGSMRDSLSLLDECRSYGGGHKITYEDALRALGSVDTAVFADFLNAMRRSDVPEAIDIIGRLVTEGREIYKFVQDYTWYLRNLMLVKASSGDVSGLNEMLGISPDNLERMQKDAADIDMSLLIRYIRAFAALTGRIRFESQKRVLVECEVISLMTAETGSADSVSAPQAKPATAAGPVEKTEAAVRPAAAPTPEPVAKPAPVKAAEPVAAPETAPVKAAEPVAAPEPAPEVSAASAAEPASAAAPAPAAGSQSEEKAKNKGGDSSANKKHPISDLKDKWLEVLETDDDPIERMAMRTGEPVIEGNKVTVVMPPGVFTKQVRERLAHVRQVFEAYVGQELEVSVAVPSEDGEEKPQMDVKKGLESKLKIPVEEEN
ncbi:MAG: DNA polymerase III subunit gamma/tau [Lachnospiraceae bacterium]|nr:DNA polymerase III subunit gamma/tau [Lachnospiraceae bacterium]